MQNANASGEISERVTGSIDLLAELALEESCRGRQAERERDLLLAKALAEFKRIEAEHELRLVKLEQEIRTRLTTLRDGFDGEKGVPGDKGEQGPPGASIQGPQARSARRRVKKVRTEIQASPARQTGRRGGRRHRRAGTGRRARTSRDRQASEASTARQDPEGQASEDQTASQG
jgi:hypothetical protein